MRRILFTIPNFITAGSGGAMLNIVRRLDRSEFSPAVCVSKKGGKLDREVDSMGIPFIEAPFTVPAQPYATLPFRALRVAALFRAYKFDLWHSFHYSDDYTEPLIAYLSGAKGWLFTKKNMNWRGRAWRLRSFFARRIAAQNTAMLASFFNTPSLSRKTRLVPRGVDIAKFRPGCPPALGLRAQFGIPSSHTVITTVGHLLPVKGHPALLRAIATIPNISLLIAGESLDSGYSASLHELCSALDIKSRVHFLGGASNITALHAESDLFVHPSRNDGRQEGCPVALLEAMSCGKACIATDIPGSQDIIQHEVNGLLVPPQDHEALSAALRRLIEQPSLRRSFEAAARKRILDSYSIEQEVAAHQGLYRDVFAAPSTHAY